MNLSKRIAELEAERQEVEGAIASLERLAKLGDRTIRQGATDPLPQTAVEAALARRYYLSERELVEEAIISLERLARGRKRRRVGVTWEFIESLPDARRPVSQPDPPPNSPAKAMRLPRPNALAWAVSGRKP